MFEGPDSLILTPEQEARNAQRVENDFQEEWEQMRWLHSTVEELLGVGSVSPKRLGQRHQELRVPKARHQ